MMPGDPQQSNLPLGSFIRSYMLGLPPETADMAALRTHQRSAAAQMLIPTAKTRSRPTTYPYPVDVPSIRGSLAKYCLQKASDKEPSYEALMMLIDRLKDDGFLQSSGNLPLENRGRSILSWRDQRDALARDVMSLEEQADDAKLKLKDLSEQILTEEGAESLEYIDAVSNDILEDCGIGEGQGSRQESWGKRRKTDTDTALGWGGGDWWGKSRKTGTDTAQGWGGGEWQAQQGSGGNEWKADDGCGGGGSAVAIRNAGKGGGGGAGKGKYNNAWGGGGGGWKTKGGYGWGGGGWKNKNAAGSDGSSWKSGQAASSNGSRWESGGDSWAGTHGSGTSCDDGGGGGGGDSWAGTDNSGTSWVDSYGGGGGYKWNNRGTKHRGGARVQEVRAALRNEPKTAECLAMLYRGAAVESDIAYLKRIFGGAQLAEFQRMSEFPQAYEPPDEAVPVDASVEPLPADGQTNIWPIPPAMSPPDIPA